MAHSAMTHPGMAHSGSPLPDLPVEAWTLIAMWLPLSAQARLRLLCRTSAGIALTLPVTRDGKLGAWRMRHPDAFVRAVASSLSHPFNRTLGELDLQVNRLGERGAVALGAALALCTCPLTSLDLRENRIGDKGAAAIGEALGCNVRLRALRLAHNSIGDSGALAIAAGLGRAAGSSPLQGLDLSHGSIGDAGATALARALSSGICLRELYLSFNQIGSDGISEIAVMLEALADVTGTRPCLRELRLQGNVSVSSAAWLHIRRAKWPELRVLGKTGTLLSGAASYPQTEPSPIGHPSTSSPAGPVGTQSSLHRPTGGPVSPSLAAASLLPPGWTDETYLNPSGRQVGRFRSPCGRCVASRASAWHESDTRTAGLRVRLKLKGAATALLAHDMPDGSRLDQGVKAQDGTPSRAAKKPRRSPARGSSPPSSSRAGAVASGGRDARQCLLREDAWCGSCGACWPQGSITYNSLATFRSKCSRHQKLCIHSRMQRGMLAGA
jgi:hypothetical protein